LGKNFGGGGGVCTKPVKRMRETESIILLSGQRGGHNQ